MGILDARGAPPTLNTYEARREGNGLLELDLPSGTRLRFPPGTDPRYLQTLAAAL